MIIRRARDAAPSHRQLGFIALPSVCEVDCMASDALAEDAEMGNIIAGMMREDRIHPKRKPVKSFREGQAAARNLCVRYFIGFPTASRPLKIHLRQRNIHSHRRRRINFLKLSAPQ
jgi:hypothetical protein